MSGREKWLRACVGHLYTKDNPFLPGKSDLAGVRAAPLTGNNLASTAFLYLQNSTFTSHTARARRQDTLMHEHYLSYYHFT